ncbi:Desiccation-related protein PCC13-62 [Spatholobus suberectus]|nr:Desiccation-related protein PCC13-62 [Spatholobus suberectus]
MTLHTLSTAVLLTSLVLPLFILSSVNVSQAQAPTSDVDRLEFQLNLEYVVAEYFLYGTTGRGLDAAAPELAQGGPPPIGGKLANLDPFTKDVFFQFALQKVGHLRAIKRAVKGFPRPLMNISKEVFAQVVDDAFGRHLHPPFDPYANPLNYRLALYIITLVAPNGYAGSIPKLQNARFKELVAGLLGVESGQDAVIREFLYERRYFLMNPYGVTVAEFTNRISDLRNKLGKEGTKDEGLVVPPSEGAEGKVSGNVLAADKDSLSYSRTAAEILRIVYGSGDEKVTGGFYPHGANGRIARSYLGTT